MPLGDVTYQDAALDAIIASWPATGAVYRIFDADPTTTGVELPSDGGYAPVAFTRSAWAAADAGLASTTDPVTLGTSTDGYGAVGTHWAITDSGGLLVYSAELDDELEVSEADTLVQFTPSIFFDNTL